MTIELLLRDRAQLIERLRDGTDVRPILTATIGTIAIAMALVGAALGSYRGGIQIGYAAIKLPLVLLGTAALSAPVLSAVGAALGRRSRLGVDLALVMSALAFGALLLAACAPLILLGRSLDVPYHQMILGTVCAFGLAGIASLHMIGAAIAAERTPGRIAALLGLCCTFALVGGQLAWALRPYLVRPRAEQVPFVREVEGSLFDSIAESMRSARGDYARDAAPLPEERP